MPDLADSRNHFRSIIGRSLPADVSVPIPKGVDCPPVECFIRILSEVSLMPGQSRTVPFVYFLGNPLADFNMFVVYWYEKQNWQELGLTPLPADSLYLPRVIFRPRFPYPDPLKVQDGRVQFIVPDNIPFETLYPQLHLIKS